MEEIILVKGESLYSVNEQLKKGWTVKMIVPVNQPVSNGSAAWGKEGIYGAYVVLQKVGEPC